MSLSQVQKRGFPLTVNYGKIWTLKKQSQQKDGTLKVWKNMNWRVFPKSFSFFRRNRLSDKQLLTVVWNLNIKSVATQMTSGNWESSKYFCGLRRVHCNFRCFRKLRELLNFYKGKQKQASLTLDCFIELYGQELYFQLTSHSLSCTTMEQTFKRCVFIAGIKVFPVFFLTSFTP